MTSEEIAKAREYVLVIKVNFLRGNALFDQVIDPNLVEFQPDLIIIDPALAYLEGDSNSNKDVGEFLRDFLNPRLEEYSCSALVVHHSNKPASGTNKNKLSGNDLAYSGAGAADWANWARMVITLQRTSTDDTYELRVAKRGKRVRWVDTNGKSTYTKFIAHSVELQEVFWRQVEEPESSIEKKKQTKKIKEKTDNDVLKCIPEEGSIEQNKLLQLCSKQGIGKQRAVRFLKELETAKMVKTRSVKRAKARDAIHWARNSIKQNG